MTNIQKLALKDRIRRELDTLRLSLSSIQTPLRCPDENELASRISECTLSEHLNHRLCIRIGALEQAMHRVCMEDYGICEDCGEPIPFSRLLAAPDVTLCVCCQTERDGEYCPAPAQRSLRQPCRTIQSVQQNIHPLPFPEVRFRLSSRIPARKRIQKADKLRKTMQTA